jgi:rhamnose transport system ATP-binding protein
MNLSNTQPLNAPTVPTLEISGISKRFAGTQALDKVALVLNPGEVHALLGENGAGKSTLIKIVTGMYKPDEGEILVEGNPVQIENAIQAQRLGIAAIYQEPRIFPDLNVAENIFIAHSNRGKVLHWRKLYSDAEAVMEKLGVKLDVRSQARDLTLAMQQSVEIAKAISLNARVLIMDEPTASLSAHEVKQLFTLVNALRNQGVAILFISHRIEEVFEIADRVTIFRDGKRISTAPVSQVTPESAIRDMVGRTLDTLFPKRDVAIGETLLSVKNLSKEGAFSNINFEIKRGEIVGFAGLVGARRTDVALALFGIAPADGGEVQLNGQLHKIISPQQAMSLGIAYVPEDRHEQGLVLPMSIIANISLPTLSQFLTGFGLIKSQKEASTAEDYRKRLSIRTPSVALEVSKLSGGNQQKVVISKWLNAKPSLLILDEPTRGIDVGAKAEVHSIISELATQGIGIMLISSDLPEVLGMSDRIVVMREGRQMAMLTGPEATQETVMTAAMGQIVETV